MNKLNLNLNLIITSIIITAGVLLAVFIFSNAYIKVNGNDEISVTGQAKTKIYADTARWTINIETTSNNREDGYNKVISDRTKITEFLKETFGGKENNEKLEDNEINFTQISSYPTYEHDYNYNNTGTVLFYNTKQCLTITSNKVYLVEDLSKRIIDELGASVGIGSSSIEYFCLDLSEKKVEMVGLATEDSVNRAKKIVESTGKKLGAINSAKTGVFQIVPIGSTEVDDYGINDSSTIEKEIICTVKSTFKIK